MTRAGTQTSAERRVFDLAVVGAGPAGIAAAIELADHGGTAVVLDLADRIGGQYFRHAAPELGGREPRAFHRGWRQFQRMRNRFNHHLEAGRIDYRPRHGVWTVERGAEFVVRALVDERLGASGTVRSRTLLVATGAYDRHLPFPGWTLPGVLAVGGAQALLKGNLVAAGRRAVIAGTGPFLLSVADGLLASGVEIAAVVEASSPARYARHPISLLAGLAKLPELVGYGARLAHHRVPYLTGQAVTEALGSDHVEAVIVGGIDRSWRPTPGPRRRLECDLVAVGYGFTPQVELLVTLGCTMGIDRDGSLIARVDGRQQTTVSGVYAAGETTGVGGAPLAITEGTVAGQSVAEAIDARAGAPNRRLAARRRRLERFADVLHDSHPVRDGWALWLGDETLVCRCEEVPYAEVRAACELGADDPRSAKLLARPGMGWCQGRICARPVSSLISQLTGRQPTIADLAAVGRRPIVQPVPLAALVDAGAEPAKIASHTSKE